MSIDLRLGKWEDVLGDVECDAIISDPPYSKRTHEGHDGAVDELRLAGEEKRMRVDRRNGAVYSVGVSRRRAIDYGHWTQSDVNAFIDAWAPRNRGWFVCMSDHLLCPAYEAAYDRHGLTTFAPVGILIPGMTVRMAGDGPSSWMLYANVARPKRLSKWGTLPGGYTGGPGERVHIGGKPLWLMRALVRDYSRRGDLICDPCAGAGTTLLAAATEGRRAVGAEFDPKTHALAMKRIQSGYTPTLDLGGA
jgi:site-specific DNA-methyltransferase (adenine-specific)